MVTIERRDTRRIVSEITFWLKLSNLFYKAFRVERHLGPQWFLINNLVGKPRLTTLGILLDSLPLQAKKRKNAYRDLSVYLDDLRDLRLLQIFEPSKDKKKQGKELQLGKQFSFKVSVEIALSKKFHKAVVRYVHGAIESLFGVKVADKNADRCAILMKEMYKFFTKQFMDAWEALLKEISELAENLHSASREAVFNELRGSSEYFVILHKIWEAYLNKDDEDGFEMKILRGMHHEARFVSDASFSHCVERLGKYGILERMPGERFRLSRDYLTAYEKYTRPFLSLRPIFRRMMEPHLRDRSRGV